MTSVYNVNTDTAVNINVYNSNHLSSTAVAATVREHTRYNQQSRISEWISVDAERRNGEDVAGGLLTLPTQQHMDKREVKLNERMNSSRVLSVMTDW